MSTTAQTNAPNVAGPVRDSHRWWVLVIVVLGTFMIALDASVVTIALPKMIAVFSTDVHSAQWVMTGFLLAWAVIIPLAGFLEETVGGKHIYVLTIALFTVASVLCGLSWSLDLLILFRLLQGIGGGLSLPIGMSMLLREFRPEERGTALAAFGIPVMLAPAIGPTLGGYLVQYVDWRFIFYLNVPIGIVAVIAASRILRETPLVRERKLDVRGTALGGIGSASLLLGVANGPTDGWGSTTVVAEILIGLLCLIAFVGVELTVEQPLLELRLFGIPNFSIGMTVAIIGLSAQFAPLLLLPLFLQDLRGMGAMQTGLLLVPQALAMAVALGISGRLLDRLGRHGPRLLLTPGLALLVYSAYRFHTLSLDTSNAQIVGLLVLAGIGLGMSMMTAQTAAMNSVPRPLIPHATALSQAMTKIGGSFMAAIMASVLTARQTYQFAVAAQTAMPWNLTVQAALAKGGALVALYHYSTAAAHQIIILQLYKAVTIAAAVRAFDDTFLVAALICILPLALSLLVYNPVNPAAGGSRAALLE